MVNWIKKRIAMWKESQMQKLRRDKIIAIAKALPSLPTLSATRAGKRVNRVYVNDGTFLVRTSTYPNYRQCLFIVDDVLVCSVSKSFTADLYAVCIHDEERTVAFIAFMETRLKL